MLKLALWKERFADALRLSGSSARTVEAYTSEVRPLFEFFEALGLRSLAEVRREHLESYREQLFHQDPPLKLSTQSLRMTAVRSFFRTLRRQGYLEQDPGLELSGIRVVGSTVRQTLSEDEMLRLLQAPNVEETLGLRDRAILEMLYSCGLRNSELCSLKLADLDAGRSQVRVVAGKGGMSRLLPLGQHALGWSLSYLEKSRPLLLKEGRDEGFLFLSLRGGKMDRETLTNLVKRAGEWAGIGAVVTPHVLRHSVATHMLARSAGIRYIQQLLGHRSLQSTQVYTRVEISHLQRVHQLTHPREQA